LLDPLLLTSRGITIGAIHEGEVFEMLVQRRRDSRAALRLIRKLLRKQGFAPKLLVTDKLRSYASAFRRLRLTCPHEQGALQKQSGGELASGGATARAQAATL
jgi:transposase-like protein